MKQSSKSKIISPENFFHTAVKEDKHSLPSPPRNHSKLILVADIGGTNSDFAVMEEKGHKLILSLHFHTRELVEFGKFMKKIVEYLNFKYKLKVNLISIAAAGRVTEKGEVHGTNLPLKISVKEIQKETRLPCFVFNDFEAMGYGIDVLHHKDLLQVKSGTKVHQQPRILLGAGTGLGKSILIWNKTTKSYIPLPSDGGLAKISIQNEEEYELMEFIKREFRIDSVCWEDVLSGKGIEIIYNFLSKKNKYALETKKMLKDIELNGASAVLISKYRKESQQCKDTFKIFAHFYARCAQNFALDALALGGVYIGGGIAAKNKDIFNTREFREEFTNNHKLKKVLEQIPIFVITNYDVSLYGAAVAAEYAKK